MAAAGSDEEDSAGIVVDIKPVMFKDLQPGDHLAVRGGFGPFKYYHHGIYIAHDEGVIDFGTTKKMKVPKKVQQIDLLNFVGGKDLARVNYPTGTCSLPNAVVCLAKEVLENPELWGPYNLKTNNCEHFAMKCKTGKFVSKQVTKVMRKRLKRVALKIADVSSSSLG